MNSIVHQRDFFDAMKPPPPPTKLTPRMQDRLKERERNPRLMHLRYPPPCYQHYHPAKCRREVLRILGELKPGEWIGVVTKGTTGQRGQGLFGMIGQSPDAVGLVLDFLLDKGRIEETELFYPPPGHGDGLLPWDRLVSPPLCEKDKQGRNLYRGYESGYRLKV